MSAKVLSNNRIVYVFSTSRSGNKYNIICSNITQTMLYHGRQIENLKSGRTEFAKGNNIQILTRLTVNICFNISRNKCNEYVSLSMTQQHRIRMNMPKLWSDQKLTQIHGVTWLTQCSPGTWRCTDKTGNIAYFCTSDMRSTNHDQVIQIVI